MRRTAGEEVRLVRLEVRDRVLSVASRGKRNYKYSSEIHRSFIRTTFSFMTHQYSVTKKYVIMFEILYNTASIMQD
jgi:hypothetical protein